MVLPALPPHHRCIVAGAAKSAQRDPLRYRRVLTTTCVIPCRYNRRGTSGEDVDADLIRSAQLGDQRAFTRIVEAVDDRFFGVARRILHDVQLAEDATQQALLNTWRHLPDLRDPTRFEAWSYQLLVKACYSESRRRRHWRLDVGLGWTDRPATSGDISNVIDRDQLERGLGRISLDHRTVLVLRYYLDLPLEQVAEVLGIPLGTVSSRLNRAHEALRGVLEADARLSARPSPSEAVR